MGNKARILDADSFPWTPILTCYKRLEIERTRFMPCAGERCNERESERWAVQSLCGVDRPITQAETAQSTAPQRDREDVPASYGRRKSEPRENARPREIGRLYAEWL